jgi:hypothetical protein
MSEDQFFCKHICRHLICNISQNGSYILLEETEPGEREVFTSDCR